MDFLVKKLPERMRRWIKVIDSIVFLLYVIFLGYYGFDAVQTSYQFGTTSRTGIDIIVWPFQLINPRWADHDESSPRLQHLQGRGQEYPRLNSGTWELPVMADLLWYEIAIIVFGLILLFLMTGIPGCVALGFVGILSAYLFLGRMGIVGYAAWQMSSSFILGAIPLFIFMGQLLLHGGVSQRLYEGSTALTGKTKGGLLQTNIIACAIFSAITGSSVATSATIGAMAIPELEKREYDRRLTLGRWPPVEHSGF